jgi:hypothetical protein
MKEQELSRALRDVSALDPEYASLQQVSIATLKSVQAVLPASATLIEYFTAGDEILAFIITGGEAKLQRKLASARRILQLQHRLGFQLEKFMLGGDYVATHSQQMLASTSSVLEELYRSLLEPFIDDVETPHIVIVPMAPCTFCRSTRFAMANNTSSINSRSRTLQVLPS